MTVSPTLSEDVATDVLQELMDLGQRAVFHVIAMVLEHWTTSVMSKLAAVNADQIPTAEHVVSVNQDSGISLTARDVNAMGMLTVVIPRQELA